MAFITINEEVRSQYNLIDMVYEVINIQVMPSGMIYYGINYQGQVLHIALCYCTVM